MTYCVIEPIGGGSRAHQTVYIRQKNKSLQTSDQAVWYQYSPVDIDNACIAMAVKVVQRYGEPGAGAGGEGRPHVRSVLNSSRTFIDHMSPNMRHRALFSQERLLPLANLFVSANSRIKMFSLSYRPRYLCLVMPLSTSIYYHLRSFAKL